MPLISRRFFDEPDTCADGPDGNAKVSDHPARSGLARVVVNIGLIAGSNLFGRVMNLVLHAALGRAFGPEGLGGYATAVALAAYFIFAVDFGVSPRIVREGAVDPEGLEREYAEALGIKIALGGLACLAIGLLSLVLPYEPWVVRLCLLLAASSILRSFSYLNQSVCRAKERLGLEGAGNVLSAVVFVGLSLAFLRLDLPVESVGWASIAAASVQLATTQVFTARFIRIGIAFPPRFEMVKRALPYATTSLSLLAFAQIDVLILSFVEEAEFVGRYAAISRLLLIAGTLASLSTAAILPTAARLYGQSDAQRFDELTNGAIRVVLSIGVGAAVGTVLVARPLIVGVYGQGFADLHPFLEAGAAFLVFKFAVSILAMVLTSRGRQGDRARSVLIGLAATVVLVPILSDLFGLAGAVGALVGSEAVLVSCLAAYLSSNIQWARLFRTLICSGFAGGAAIYTWSLLRADHSLEGTLLSLAAPACVFLAGLILTGEGLRVGRFVLQLRRGGT